MEKKKFIFKCIECQKIRKYTFFIDDDMNEHLTNKCIFCQKGIESPKKKIKKCEMIPNEDEFRCRRCRCIRSKDNFLIIKKTQLPKYVKTCQKCRETDKKLKSCEHLKNKYTCKLCHEVDLSQ